MKTALFLLYNTYNIQSHRAKTQKLKNPHKKPKKTKTESQSGVEKQIENR